MEVEKFNAFRGVPWSTVPGYEQDEIKSHIVLPPPSGPIIPPEAAQEKPTHAPRRIGLRQDDVIKAGFTKGCPGCLDIHAGKGGMRGSATHNEECREKVESYLRRTKSKRMAAYEENLPEKIVRFEEARAKKQKVDTFVEAEILGDEDVEDEEMITNLPPRTHSENVSVFENLEEEMDRMDARELSRKRSQRVPEEDEEEQARTMKYQIHETEVPSESHSDVTMGSINKVWLCSFGEPETLSQRRAIPQ